MLIRLESDFWGCIQSNTPPLIDGSQASAKFLNESFPDSMPLSVELPDTAAEHIRQYDEACAELGRLTERKLEAENLLKQMLGENETGIVNGSDRIITWKTTMRECFDSKALKSEHPELYKKYLNQSSHRRFSIKAAI